jgi:hypothetical protein
VSQSLGTARFVGKDDTSAPTKEARTDRIVGATEENATARNGGATCSVTFVEADSSSF